MCSLVKPKQKKKIDGKEEIGEERRLRQKLV